MSKRRLTRATQEVIIRKMLLSRRLTAFASGLLGLLAPLLLGAGDAAACGSRMMPTPGSQDASMMSGMEGMEMPTAPSDDASSSASDHGSGCPDSGIPSDACRTMAACAPVVAIAPSGVMIAQLSIATEALVATQVAPHSPTVRPEPPPPRA